MRDEPTTPEGRLIRRYRKRQSPEPSLEELAARLGWSDGKLGAIERGHTTRNPDRHPSVHDLARLAAELGIPASELGKAADGAPELSRQVLTGAAEILRADAPEPEPATSDLDRLVEAIAKARPGDDTIRFLWRQTDGEGRLRPAAERVDLVVNWLADRPAKPSQEGLKAV